MAGNGDIMVQRWSPSRLVVVAFLLTATLIVAAPTPAAALCISPMEALGKAPEQAVNHRYAWFLIESLSHARLAWQEADGAADSQNPAVRLANLKLAVDDFQCAASLVNPFQGVRGPDEYTTKALRTSALAATVAYITFGSGFQQWVTALARGDAGLPLEAAADFKVQNEKAAEHLMHAATAAFFALMNPTQDPQAPMDRLSLTRAHRAALVDGLKSRRFRPDPDQQSPDTHSPDFAAAILYKGLSSPKYKAADEP